MPNCLLCGQETDIAGIGKKPETALERILSIDGGGSRVVISLRALMALDAEIKVPMISQRAVDMAIGTSSGQYSPALTLCHASATTDRV
jgi:hypothetical protein